jgi:hypothetical protein
MPSKPSKLTAFGRLVEQKGLAVGYVIEKSGIDRKRLAYLRTNDKATITLPEAAALAPVLGMSIDQLHIELGRVKPQDAGGESSAG